MYSVLSFSIKENIKVQDSKLNEHSNKKRKVFACTNMSNVMSTEQAADSSENTEPLTGVIDCYKIGWQRTISRRFVRDISGWKLN